MNIQSKGTESPVVCWAFTWMADKPFRETLSLEPWANCFHFLMPLHASELFSACPANGHWPGNVCYRKIIKVQLFQNLNPIEMTHFYKTDSLRGKSMIFFICPWANNSNVFLQPLRRGEGTCCQPLRKKKPRLWVAVKKHLKTTGLPTTEDFLTLSTMCVWDECGKKLNSIINS